MAKLIDSLCVVSTRGYAGRIKDSIDDDEYRQFDRFNDLREVVSDKEIVDVLPSYMGGYEINKFVDKVRNFYGLEQNHDGEIEDSKDEEMTRRKSAMSELSKLRESVSDKDIVEALVKVSSSEDLFDLIDRLRSNFSIKKPSDHDEKSSKRKVSDAAYNPKFEKLRKVLSDTTIVEELSHYMSSDELEEFTETLSRNYDIDLDSEVLDSSDSSRKEEVYSYLEENEDEDIEDKIESVTNILFGDTPDFFNKVNWVSSSLLPNTLDPSEYAVLHVEPEAEGKVALRLDTIYDDPKQLEWISAEVADIIGVDDSVVPKAGYFLVNSDGDIKYLGYSAKDFDNWVRRESSKK